MRRRLASIVARLLRTAGYQLQRADAPPEFPFSKKQFEVAAAIDRQGLVALLRDTKAKDGQDLLAAYLTDGPGYFVDIGAYDGVHKSNTWLLEKVLGWDGICVEPHPEIFRHLENARGSRLDARAVSDVAGETVRIVLDDQRTRIADGALSEQAEYAEVTTVSIARLLSEHAAPPHIDYLSIDVEGKEFDILSGFPFAERTIGLVTAEHNFDEASRSSVRALLEREGYVPVLPHLSRNEDWFVNASGLQRLGSALG